MRDFYKMRIQAEQHNLGNLRRQAGLVNWNIYWLGQKIAMTVTKLLESVRRVEVRTNRLVNDTLGGEPQRALTRLALNGNRKA